MTAIIWVRSSFNFRRLSNSIAHYSKTFSLSARPHSYLHLKCVILPGTPTKPTPFFANTTQRSVCPKLKNKPLPIGSPPISLTPGYVLKITQRSNSQHGGNVSTRGSPKASTSTPTANTRTRARAPPTLASSSDCSHPLFRARAFLRRSLFLRCLYDTRDTIHRASSAAASESGRPFAADSFLCEPRRYPFCFLLPSVAVQTR